MENFKKPVAAFFTVVILAVVAWLLYDNYTNKIKTTKVFLEKPKIIMGLTLDTSFELPLDEQSREIGDMWKKFHEEAISSKLENLVIDNPSFYGVYYNFNDKQNGAYSVLAGSEVSAVSEVSNFQFVTIPIGKYMLFQYKYPKEGFSAELVVNGWMDVDKYFDNHKLYERTYEVDFEVYEPNELKIYVSYEAKK